MSMYLVRGIIVRAPHYIISRKNSIFSCYLFFLGITLFKLKFLFNKKLFLRIYSEFSFYLRSLNMIKATQTHFTERPFFLINFCFWLSSNCQHFGTKSLEILSLYERHTDHKNKTNEFSVWGEKCYTLLMNVKQCLFRFEKNRFSFH